VLQVNFGLTPVQAQSYRKTTVFLVGTMGPMLTNQNASHELLQFIGRVSHFLSNQVVLALLSGTKKENLFTNTGNRRDLFIDPLYNQYQVPEEFRNGRFLPNIAFNIVPLASSRNSNLVAVLIPPIKCLSCNSK
jgi:hypothetical protein